MYLYVTVTLQSAAAPQLALELGAGSANMRVIRVTMRPTPSHSPTSNAMSTQSSSTAPIIYRGANTFHTMRWRRSHAALSALPSSSAPKYWDIPRAARTAASTATRAWLAVCCCCCDPCVDADRRPCPGEVGVSDTAASGAMFQIPRSGTANAMRTVGPTVLSITSGAESG
jgi:hypothetical protein